MDKVAADVRKHIQSCIRWNDITGYGITDACGLHACLESYFCEHLVLIYWCIWLLRSKNHRKENRLKSGCYKFSCA